MFLLVSIAVCFLGASLHGTEAASCHMREVDLCLATVLLSLTEGFPTTNEDIDRICEPIQEGLDCIGNYSVSCFTPLLDEIRKMIMTEVEKQQKAMCTHGTDERARFLKHAPCFSEVLSADSIRPDIDDFMVALEACTTAPFQERIPILCCGIQRLVASIMKKVEEKCGKEVLDEGSMMIGMSFSTISTTFCGGYGPGSTECSARLPPPGTPNRGSESKLQLIQFLNTALSNLQ